jgi:hypothetical protein
MSHLGSSLTSATQPYSALRRLRYVGLGGADVCGFTDVSLQIKQLPILFGAVLFADQRSVPSESRTLFSVPVKEAW